MNRAHTDAEIIEKASGKEKPAELIKDNKVDIAVDMDDDKGTCHTYVVTFGRQSGANDWSVVEITELSPGA